MAHIVVRALILAPCLVLAEPRAALAQSSPPAPAPWDQLGPNLADAFGGSSLVWEGAGVVSSIALAESGADYGARTWVRHHVHARGFADACVVGGYVLPAVVPPGIYVAGMATGDAKAAYAGAAAVQSVTVTVVTVGLLKWGVGRPYPNDGRDPNAPDALDHPEDARLAAIGPFGEHWMMAWPSGHTAATMSIAAALYGFAPEHAWLGWAGYPVALGIGAGMIVGDHHWVSDVAAGAMLAYAIGFPTGRAFRSAFDGPRARERRSTRPVVHAVRPIFLEGGGWGIGVLGSL